MVCPHCNDHNPAGFPACIECLPPYILDTSTELTGYMATKQPYYSWTTLTDQQFKIFKTRLTTDISAVEWYKLLHGLTQDFPHVLLSAAQVREIIDARTSHEYVHAVYSRCYEPWLANVGNDVANCYWISFGEMVAPNSQKILYDIFDKMFGRQFHLNWYKLGECPICFEEIIGATTWSTSCCHNAIHCACLEKCSVCPLCRGQYVNSQQLL